MNQKQIVTISFFHFETPNKWWAFKQMGIIPTQLTKIEGLSFGKMLGSGAGNGFSIFPNLKMYGLLVCWESEDHANRFFHDHAIFNELSGRAVECFTLFMKTVKTHGEWGQQSPFEVTADYDANQLVGVLTRATIHPKHLWRFWKYVPKVSASVENKKGRLFSVGVGELPLIQQATFSLWESSKLMKAYAYQSQHHRDMVKKTREIGWYKEELFARFIPYDYQGSWQSLDLENIFKSKFSTVCIK